MKNTFKQPISYKLHMKNVLNFIVFDISECRLYNLLLFSIYYYTFLNVNIHKINIYKYFINVYVCIILLFLCIEDSIFFPFNYTILYIFKCLNNFQKC